MYSYDSFVAASGKETKNADNGRYTREGMMAIADGINNLAKAKSTAGPAQGCLEAADKQSQEIVSLEIFLDEMCLVFEDDESSDDGQRDLLRGRHVIHGFGARAHVRRARIRALVSRCVAGGRGRCRWRGAAWASWISAWISSWISAASRSAELAARRGHGGISRAW